MRYTSAIAILLLLWSCQSEAPGEQPTAPEPLHPEKRAERVIEQALKAHGSALVDSAAIEFDFRKFQFRVKRQGGKYVYTRTFRDSSGAVVRDRLSNDGLIRSVEGQTATLSPEDSAAYASSVNSVVYFALLPYFLQDEAVQATYLDTARINGEPYHKLKVTFRQAGGGEDYQDEYVYWFHRGRYTMDYLAYNYQADGGGARFREAYNIRQVDGLRIADYRNFKPTTDSREVAVFDSLFQAGQMEQVSLIKTENVSLSR